MKKGLASSDLLFHVKTRKTYISTLLNKGVDADFVRTQVGHRDLQTTLNSYAFSTTRKTDY